MQARVPWLASEGQSPFFRGHFSPFSLWVLAVEFVELSLVFKLGDKRFYLPTYFAGLCFFSLYLMLHFIFNQYAVEGGDNLDLTLEGKSTIFSYVKLAQAKDFIDLGHGLSSKENKLSFCLGSRWR